ncbi:hypothetical protein HELRODRAFT_171765 [Helobdella robusta]|uniref:Uncharacterized protein n=1 Tax=Helobdella robusta TaxID=6412 RepID=T1F4M5_HELRO|nr:hypothetical protein HELRODRAFT_171765 [Helobdella robusta]ESO05373.1 hypothetical protein HELRODRAFT_171765 [Helobdella robusta]
MTEMKRQCNTIMRHTLDKPPTSATKITLRPSRNEIVSNDAIVFYHQKRRYFTLSEKKQGRVFVEYTIGQLNTNTYKKYEIRALTLESTAANEMEWRISGCNVNPLRTLFELKPSTHLLMAATRKKLLIINGSSFVKQNAADHVENGS